MFLRYELKGLENIDATSSPMPCPAKPILPRAPLDELVQAVIPAKTDHFNKTLDFSVGRNNPFLASKQAINDAFFQAKYTPIA